MKQLVNDRVQTLSHMFRLSEWKRIHLGSQIMDAPVQVHVLSPNRRMHQQKRLLQNAQRRKQGSQGGRIIGKSTNFEFLSVKKKST